MKPVADNSPNVIDSDVDALALQFLKSDYPDGQRAAEPLNRRLDCFLRRRGLARLADSGDIYNIILGRAVSYLNVLDRQRGQQMS